MAPMISSEEKPSFSRLNTVSLSIVSFWADMVIAATAIQAVSITLFNLFVKNIDINFVYRFFFVCKSTNSFAINQTLMDIFAKYGFLFGNSLSLHYLCSRKQTNRLWH
jgi:hypothetical protein